LHNLISDALFLPLQMAGGHSAFALTSPGELFNLEYGLSVDSGVGAEDLCKRTPDQLLSKECVPVAMNLHNPRASTWCHAG
jgi:hypothetical protein